MMSSPSIPHNLDVAGATNLAPRLSLGSLFSQYRWRILLTYALFNLENMLNLLRPLALGLAINDLLQSSFAGLAIYAVLHLAHLFIGSLRRAYDTRVYTHIYTNLASELIVGQRRREVETSRVSARSALSRALVDFFERDVPVVLRTLYFVVGSLLMLLFYDWLLSPLCIALLAPAFLLNRFYSKKTLFLNSRLHDQLEKEVDVINKGSPDCVREHYQRAGNWRIKLSDWEAINFGLIELFILALMAGALVRTCSLGLAVGDILAIFRYVLMFVMGLDSVPMLVQKVSKLRDIGRRLAL